MPAYSHSLLDFYYVSQVNVKNKNIFLFISNSSFCSPLCFSKWKLSLQLLKRSTLFIFDYFSHPPWIHHQILVALLLKIKHFSAPEQLCGPSHHNLLPRLVQVPPNLPLCFCPLSLISLFSSWSEPVKMSQVLLLLCLKLVKGLLLSLRLNSKFVAITK